MGLREGLSNAMPPGADGHSQPVRKLTDKQISGALPQRENAVSVVSPCDSTTQLVWA